MVISIEVSRRRKMWRLMHRTKPLSGLTSISLCHESNGQEIANWLRRSKTDRWTSRRLRYPRLGVRLTRMIHPKWQDRSRAKALNRVRKTCARTSNAYSLMAVKRRDAAKQAATIEKNDHLGILAVKTNVAAATEAAKVTNSKKTITTVCNGCQLTFYSVVGKVYSLSQSKISRKRNKADVIARDIFRRHGLLPQAVLCQNNICYGLPCRRVAIRVSNGGIRWIWRCQKSIKSPTETHYGKPKVVRCTWEVSDNSGTILDNSHLRPAQVLLIMNAWCRKTWNQEMLAHELGIDVATISRWKAKLDGMCLSLVTNSDTVNGMIGGPGIVVEIDETIVSRFKKGNEQSRPRKSMWVFGGTERHGNGRFIVPLLKTRKDISGKAYIEELLRTKEVLLPLIQQYIAPGSIIMTDKWKSYISIPKYPLCDPDDERKACPDHLKYKHYDVNHGKEYVRKDEPYIHINTVERMWRDMKEWMSVPGIRRQYLKRYIARYRVMVGTPKKMATPAGMKKARIFRDNRRLHKTLMACGKVYPHPYQA